MSGAGARKVTEVAVGVLLRADDAVLLADRPAGKPYAGYWEFPGGKVEPGESVAQALARELHEELGIDIGPAQPWVTFEFDYPHAYVRLHFCRVYQWRGTPQSREGQQLRFFRLDELLPQPLLPAAVPALRWLSLPTLVAECAADTMPPLSAFDAALARGLRLLVLRADDSVTLKHEAALRARLAAFGARLMQAPKARNGMHRELPTAPLDGAAWFGVDADSRAAIAAAATQCADYAVVSPVLPTPLVAGGQMPAGVPLGWHGAAPLLRETPLPVYLAGGLDRGDLDHAREAGAHGLLLPLAAWLD